MVAAASVSGMRLLARVVVQHLQRGVAQAALGRVDDALEGEVVGRLRDHAQVGERVADLHALVKPRPADHAVGQAELDEALFEFAHLERGAHQERDLVERMILAALARLALHGFDHFADGAGFFLQVPGAGDGHLLAQHVLGAQRFAKASFIVRDQMARRRQDMPCAPVVPLKPDDFGARKIMIEPENVIDLGASPAINRLIVIAHAADVFLRLRRRHGLILRDARALPSLLRMRIKGFPCGTTFLLILRSIAKRGADLTLILRSIAKRCVSKDEAPGLRRLRQQPQPQILRHVGVLILVHQDVSKPLLVLPQHVRMLAEQADALQQQVAEVGGVQRLQPLLIGEIKLLALAVGEARRLAGRHHVGGQPAVLPAVQDHGEDPRRPSFIVELLGFQQLLDQPDLVVHVEDGEAALEADHLGVAAQDFHADRVESAEPGHALDDLADHQADAVLHFARRLVGEGDGEDFARPRPPQVEDVGNSGRQDARLAGPRAGQHQHRPVQRLDRLALLRVEIGQIGRRAGAQSARGNASRYGLARWNGDMTLGLGHLILSGRRWHSCALNSRAARRLVRCLGPL